MQQDFKHTLGFLAGGYQNIAQFKGISLAPYQELLAPRRFHSLLIGWDAADWAVAMPLLEKGALPNLAALMQGGLHAPIASMDPPISPMLWTSIATSRWPIDHGIHGFTEWHEDHMRAVRGTSITAPTFWEVLESSGTPASTVAWWPSHPAQPSVQGAVRISNLAVAEESSWLQEGMLPSALQPLFEALRIRPEEVPAEALASFFPEQELDSTDDVVRSVLKILVHALNVYLAASIAMAAAPGGHLSIYFDALDHFKHLAMKYHPPQLSAVTDEDFAKYHFIVEAAYRLHDLFLGTYIESQPEANTFLISDHGFRSGEERWTALPNHAGAPALEHKFYGIFVAKGPQIPGLEQISGLTLLDIAPMVLATHNLKALPEMAGHLPAYWPTPTQEVVLRSAPQAVEQGRSPQMEEELLDTLVKLGYLEAQDRAQGGARLVENGYYLARSLRAQQRPREAWQVLQSLELGPGSPSRYLLLGAALLAESKQFEALAEFVDWIQEDALAGVKEYYLRLVKVSRGGDLELPEGLLEPMDGGVVPKEQVVLWGRLLAKAGRWEELDPLLQKTDSQAVDVLNLRLMLALEREDWQGAMESALASTEQVFHQPKVHGALAFVFGKLGMSREANFARGVYQNMMDEAVAPHIIVTGPPRSGTSLAMQLLRAGGIELVTDEKRTADEHNAAGYFEHELIKEWQWDASWIEEQRGKAMKVVFPLLRQAPLPAGPKLIVVMRRGVQSVLQSQRRMASAEGAPLQWEEHDRWEQEYVKHERWWGMEPQAEVVELVYEELLDAVERGEVLGKLATALKTLSKYCVKSVDISLLKAVVNKDLRRF